MQHALQNAPSDEMFQSAPDSRAGGNNPSDADPCGACCFNPPPTREPGEILPIYFPANQPLARTVPRTRTNPISTPGVHRGKPPQEQASPHPRTHPSVAVTPGSRSHDQRALHVQRFTLPVMLGACLRHFIEKVESQTVLGLREFMQQPVPQYDPLGLAHDAFEDRLLYPHPVVLARLS